MRPDRDKPRARPTVRPVCLERDDVELAPVADDADAEDADQGLVDLTPERFRELIAAVSRAESPPPPAPVRAAIPNCAA
jgi:hypothetical protein